VIQSAANLAAGRGIGRHVEFPDKLPLFREYLDPVLSTFADVDEAFFREFGEMQIGDEVLFLRRRASDPLVSRDRVIRDLAQRHPVTAPAALEGARIHVVHENALPIDNVDLSRVFVEVEAAFGDEDVGLLIIFFQGR